MYGGTHLSPLLKLLTSVSSLALLGYGASALLPAHAENDLGDQDALPVVRIDTTAGADASRQFAAVVDDFLQLAQTTTVQPSQRQDVGPQGTEPSQDDDEEDAGADAS